MQKFPIDSYSNENFISHFYAPRGPLTPKRGEDTPGTRVRPHAKFGMNRPAGCREMVDKKANKQKKHTVKQYIALRSNERMAGNKHIYIEFSLLSDIIASLWQIDTEVSILRSLSND